MKIIIFKIIIVSRICPTKNTRKSNYQSTQKIAGNFTRFPSWWLHILVALYYVLNYALEKTKKRLVKTWAFYSSRSRDLAGSSLISIFWLDSDARWYGTAARYLHSGHHFSVKSFSQKISWNWFSRKILDLFPNSSPPLCCTIFIHGILAFSLFLEGGFVFLQDHCDFTSVRCSIYVLLGSFLCPLLEIT